MGSNPIVVSEGDKMKVEKIQNEPPTYEVSNFKYGELIDWLRKEDLEDDMSLSCNGFIYHFCTKEERTQFSSGFDLAWDLVGT